MRVALERKSGDCYLRVVSVGLVKSSIFSSLVRMLTVCREVKRSSKRV